MLKIIKRITYRQTIRNVFVSWIGENTKKT